MTPVLLRELEIQQLRTSGNTLTATCLPKQEQKCPCMWNWICQIITQSINGYVVIETNSKIYPNFMIRVNEKYIAPAEIISGFIIIKKKFI
jgi:hypothetical protein